MKLVKNYLDLENLDAHLIEHEDEITFCEEGKAIVFFEANWSGSSRKYRIALAHRLNTLNLAGAIFFIIDIDELSGEAVKRILGKQSHGQGEAVFLISGKIMARHAAVESFGAFLAYLDNEFDKSA